MKKNTTNNTKYYYSIDFGDINIKDFVFAVSPYDAAVQVEGIVHDLESLYKKKIKLREITNINYFSM